MADCKMQAPKVDRPYPLLSIAGIVVLALVIGFPTIRSDNYFLGDDFGFIHQQQQLTFSRFLEYFRSDWSGVSLE